MDKVRNVKIRHNFIGSTDAKRILEGDWHTLWKEKTGRQAPEDLSHVFKVQLGIATENFHAEWLNRDSEFRNVEPDVYNEHPTLPYVRSHIDRWLVKQDTWLELKHTHERMTAWEIADYYLPQCAHHCLATSRSHGWISFIAGNKEPVATKVEPPFDYVEQLKKLEEAFWWHVEHDVEPEVIPMGAIRETKKAAIKVVVNNMRRVEMTTSNAWADAADRYHKNQASAQAFETAKKDLKELVPADASMAFGHGICIKRDSRNALRFTGGDDE